MVGSKVGAVALELPCLYPRFPLQNPICLKVVDSQDSLRMDSTGRPALPASGSWAGQRTTHRAVYLQEQRGLIKRTGHVFGRNGGGLIFQVNHPPIASPKVANEPEWIETQPSDLFFDSQEQENPPSPPDPHLQEVIAAYERETNNRWRPSDAASYEKVKHVPTVKTIQAVISAKARAASRPNSFSYFIKEILDQANPSGQSRNSRKHALKKIVDRIRSLHVGAHNYTAIDFIEDVKIACAREGVAFDNDLFNQMMR
jgi:hypothetical protein